MTTYSCLNNGVHSHLVLAVETTGRQVEGNACESIELVVDYFYCSGNAGDKDG